MKLKNEHRREEIINRSRFIACACPVKNEENARAYIDQIRAEFPDATHVCTAYVTGPGSMIRRSSDNKEPSGTAGVPMLEAILASGITDVCVCVVRYFGGIKLGAGGLIRAYSGSVSACLAEAAKTKEVPMDIWAVTYPYSLSGSVESWLRRNTVIEDISYGEQVTCIFESTLDIENIIRDLSRGSVQAELLEHTFREVDV
ncbi:MAG: IMPACT family protein [Solobacterium sp.]|nr:IMPACT family protein [Solobacterium sp.]